MYKLVYIDDELVMIRNSEVSDDDIVMSFPEDEIKIVLSDKKPEEMIIEEKQSNVRGVRDRYFVAYVDFYQSKPLYWEELDEEFKQQVSDYRNYLKDYTKEENWWEKNPLNFEEWKMTI